MSRIQRVKDIMRQNQVSQMIICNPADVFYLSGQQTNSKERFMGIMFCADGVCRLFTNPLFAITGCLPEDLEVVSVAFGESDTDVMAGFLDPGKQVLWIPGFRRLIYCR